jgi:hypothetical protein
MTSPLSDRKAARQLWNSEILVSFFLLLDEFLRYTTYIRGPLPFDCGQYFFLIISKYSILKPIMSQSQPSTYSEEYSSPKRPTYRGTPIPPHLRGNRYGGVSQVER